jgi:hypothetical protein
MLILMQDRCAVYAKCTIGSEIILDTPDGTPSDEFMWKLISVHSEVVLILRQDWCTVSTECTIRLGNHSGHTRRNSKVT